MDLSQRSKKVLDILSKEFPDAGTALKFSNPLELLIATVLSAQATDKLVNKVTVELFKKYKTASDYARTPRAELEGDISSVNFFRNKAKSIKGLGEKLAGEYGGEVPDTLDDLTSLPGVGRKTANIILGNAFGIDALAVDTHVKRVSGRLGFTTNTDPDKIEVDLCGIIPKKRWTATTHLLILHGRKTCKARGPLCNECPVSALCDYFKTTFKKK
jgi:endonuclease-3